MSWYYLEELVAEPNVRSDMEMLKMVAVIFFSLVTCNVTSFPSSKLQLVRQNTGTLFSENGGNLIMASNTILRIGKTEDTRGNVTGVLFSLFVYHVDQPLAPALLKYPISSHPFFPSSVLLLLKSNRMVLFLK